MWKIVATCVLFGVAWTAESQIVLHLKPKVDFSYETIPGTTTSKFSKPSNADEVMCELSKKGFGLKKYELGATIFLPIPERESLNDEARVGLESFERIGYRSVFLKDEDQYYDYGYNVRDEILFAEFYSHLKPGDFYFTLDSTTVTTYTAEEYWKQEIKIYRYEGPGSESGDTIVYQNFFEDYHPRKKKVLFVTRSLPGRSAAEESQLLKSLLSGVSESGFVKWKS